MSLRRIHRVHHPPPRHLHTDDTAPSRPVRVQVELFQVQGPDTLRDGPHHPNGRHQHDLGVLNTFRTDVPLRLGRQPARDGLQGGRGVVHEAVRLDQLDRRRRRARRSRRTRARVPQGQDRGPDRRPHARREPERHLRAHERVLHRALLDWPGRGLDEDRQGQRHWPKCNDARSWRAGSAGAEELCRDEPERDHQGRGRRGSADGGRHQQRCVFNPAHTSSPRPR